MGNNLLEDLANKSLTKEKLLRKVKKNINLIPEIISGVSSSKATIRYGCAKVLMDLSEDDPSKLYPHMDFFINLLDSKYRILTWNAMAVLANLTEVDKDKKFEKIFDKYFSFINNEYLVTVANVIANSSKIAQAKPHLIPKITNELLKVEDIKINPHLTAECKRVVAEKTIESFGSFFEKIKNKDEVISFVKKYQTSSRKTLKEKAQNFLNKWDK